jgi:quercetin dioxygenase-like cupin family protein
VKLPNLPEESIHISLLTPVDFESKAEPYIIEIPPNKTLSSHFFIHKGEEVGYLLSGKLQLKLEKGVYTIQTHDIIYLTHEIPAQWENPGPDSAKLLWMKIN